jgi:hypothetical protein
MSLDLFREDLEKQSQGSPCYVNQMIFNVRRIGTKEVQAEFKDIRERLYGLFPKPSDINDNEILANWLAHGGVTGWDNVTDDENGEPLEFTPSFARQLFLNKAYWLSLNQVLINHATNFENYLNDEAYSDTEELKKK